jgi:hypothetical protein
MVQRYKVRRAEIRTRVRGRLPRFNEDRAIKRAQEKSAKAILLVAKAKARAAMKPEGLRHEPERRGVKMIIGYRTNVRKDFSISLYNTNRKGKWFEEGTQPHFIFAMSGKTLKFNLHRGGEFVYPAAVAHPGQEARPVMHEAMRESVSLIERNLAESIERELSTRGAR